MKTKLYLDTSVPSAYYDTSKPIRQLMTQHWFQIDVKNFDLYTSVITIEEIDRLTNTEKKQKIKLAKKYIENGAIPKSEIEDAYHIAVATYHKIECLALWNFKHIVSMNPIRKIHEINRKNNFEIIEIGSLEIFGGYKYGNL